MVNDDDDEMSELRLNSTNYASSIESGKKSRLKIKYLNADTCDLRFVINCLKWLLKNSC